MSTQAIGYALIGLILGALTINYIFTDSPEAPAQLSGSGVTVANPASVFCVENGGSLSMNTTAEGTVGTCTFPTGEQCEEWALFRGECDVDGVSTRATYSNGTNIVRVVYRIQKDAAVVTASDFGIENTEVHTAVSASGARYLSDDSRLEVWEHQGELTVTRDEQQIFTGKISE